MERQAATDPAVGKRTSSSTSALTLAALGVVYGDIGTSPLYALREVLREGGMGTSPDTILGALSLIFWTITIVVSINYVWLVLEADNNGEGGLIAMLALATSAVRSRTRLRNVLMSIGLFGTAVFFGDGVITPAISVLSAVEGLNVVTPALSDTVVPITLVVLLVLFSAQRFGTGGIGRAFGPITLVWFAVLVAIGIPHIVANPGVLAALNPFCAIDFAIAHPGVAFVALGAVMLCITGCEALYADMGHFGKRPIRLAWYGLVMPALLVNYFGQGALLLGEPSAIENPFYLMAPDWGRLPLVVLATAATVIASQALISAAFSVTRQAIQLGFLPRMTLRHTSVKDVGQIYLPFINWALFLLITLVVGFFGSSSNLSSAYGVAVSIDMSITTVMAFFVLAFGWKYPLPLCVLVTGAFFLVDVAFLSSNMLKLPSGGWFPLVVGFAMFLLMATWTQGRRIMGDAMRRDAIGLGEFLDSVFLAPPTRVSGTAVFMVPDPGVTPRALMHNLKHNKVLHEHNVFVTLRSHDVPWIAPEERLELTPLGRDCWQVVLHFGFKNDPDVPQALAPLAARGVPLPALDTSYFLSRETVIPRLQGGMSYWREKLFASLHHNASAAADFLSLPSNRVVELGSQVEI